MSQRSIVRLLVFIGILIVLHALFGIFGVHEHIDVMGSIILTIVLAFGMTWLFGSRRS